MTVRRVVPITLVIVLGAACRWQSEAPVSQKETGVSVSGVPGVAAGAQGSPGETEKRVPASPSPLSQKDLPTTAPSIAIGNLESSITDADARLASGRGRGPAFLSSLAGLHLMHGRLVGNLAEYDRAAELIERAVKEGPNEARVYLGRAEVKSTFHQFDEALADIARAVKLKADSHEVDTERASVLVGMGRIAEARPIVERWAKELPDISTLGALAGIAADEGRLDEAEQIYLRAEHAFSDVYPFPVAALWFQEGLMWQKAGRPARARELFEGALERMPVHAAAIAHLADVEAQTGEREKAIERLRGLVQKSDDPEYRGQLAALLAAAGKTAEAEPLRAEAKAGFAKLLLAHPLAYGDHAARFFLSSGDARAALALAEKNLAARKTGDAYQLVVEAALAAGDHPRACAASDAMVTAFPKRLAFHNLAWKAFLACGKKERADAELKLAESLPR